MVRTFRNLDTADFRLIYKTYIRPHMEFWGPIYKISYYNQHVLSHYRKSKSILR